MALVIVSAFAEASTAAKPSAAREERRDHAALPFRFADVLARVGQVRTPFRRCMRFPSLPPPLNLSVRTTHFCNDRCYSNSGERRRSRCEHRHGIGRRREQGPTPVRRMTNDTRWSRTGCVLYSFPLSRRSRESAGRIASIGSAVIIARKRPGEERHSFAVLIRQELLQRNDRHLTRSHPGRYSSIGVRSIIRFRLRANTRTPSA